MARRRGVEWEFVQGDFMRETCRQRPGPDAGKVLAALLPGYLTSGNCTSSGNCSWSQTRAALSP